MTTIDRSTTMHRKNPVRRALAPALTLLALLLVAPAAAQAEERPEWVFWYGQMHVHLTQDTAWQYHDSAFDGCTGGTLKYDGSGDEQLTASTEPGKELIGIFMHAKTGELFLRSEDRSRPSFENNTIVAKARATVDRHGEIEVTRIGGGEPQCGGDPENGSRPPRPDCGIKKGPFDLLLRFNGALEKLQVRGHDTAVADPLYANCPNVAPVKAPNIIREFSRKVVGEGAIDDDTWAYRIAGHGESRGSGKVSWLTRLDWTTQIYRYGDYVWVAGKGDSTPVPYPEDRAGIAPPTAEQIAAAPVLTPQQADAKLAKKAPRKAAKKKKRRATKKRRSAKAKHASRRRRA